MQRKAFTMVEIIFVIVILGVLTAIAIPKLSATRDDAQVTACTQDIRIFMRDIQGYSITHGSTLPNITDLQKITNATIAIDDTGTNFNFSASGGNGNFKSIFYKYNCFRKNTLGEQPSVFLGFFSYTNGNRNSNITLTYNSFTIGPKIFNSGESILFVLESNSNREIDKLLQQRLSLIGKLNEPISLGSRIKI